MRFSTGRNSHEIAVDMTPMIDVIFQLALFFVFSMKFAAFEGQIQAYLPRDRGPAPEQTTAEPSPVNLFLAWDSAGGGKVLCRAEKFIDSAGRVSDNYLFPMEAGVTVEAGSSGKPRARTEARIQGPTRDHQVTYDFAAPEWPLVETYLRERKAAADKLDRRGTGLQVTVSFEKKVPWQATANVLDICTRVKITNFALSMTEIEP